jgi:hypothetical protein
MPPTDVDPRAVGLAQQLVGRHHNAAAFPNSRYGPRFVVRRVSARH